MVAAGGGITPSRLARTGASKLAPQATTLCDVMVKYFKKFLTRLWHTVWGSIPKNLINQAKHSRQQARHRYGEIADMAGEGFAGSGNTAGREEEKKSIPRIDLLRTRRNPWNTGNLVKAFRAMGFPHLKKVMPLSISLNSVRIGATFSSTISSR